MLSSRPSSPPRAGRVVALLAVAALAAACVPPTGSTGSPAPTVAPTASPSANPYDGAAAGSGAGVKLGYLSYGDQVPFVAEISAGIRSQASVAGADLVECDAKLEAKNVASCMKTLSDAGIKGLIQFQGTLVDPQVACTEAPSGVPVLAVEFDQPPCSRTLVSADDLRAGQIAGTAVGQWVKAKWGCTYDAYVSLESTTAADRSLLRMQGYRQGFSAVCPITNEQIGRTADTTPTAEAAMTAVLDALPGKSRIVAVAINDDAAIGALNAAKTANRPGDVWVSGQGAEPKVRDLIRNDAQYIGDAAYFPERYGSTIVPALLDLVAGKTVQPLLLIEPQWVDAANINQVYPQ